MIFENHRVGLTVKARTGEGDEEHNNNNKSIQTKIPTLISQ